MSVDQILLALSAVLALGALYAWVQFALFLVKRVPGVRAHPFRSKCFVGATIFSVGFALSIYALTQII